MFIRKETAYFQRYFSYTEPLSHKNPQFKWFELRIFKSILYVIVLELILITQKLTNSATTNVSPHHKHLPQLPSPLHSWLGVDAPLLIFRDQ